MPEEYDAGLNGFRSGIERQVVPDGDDAGAAQEQEVDRFAASLEAQRVDFVRLRTSIIKGVSWFILGFAAVILVVYALNVILPPGLRWLEAEALAKIERLVISILSGVICTAAIHWLFQKH